MPDSARGNTHKPLKRVPCEVYSRIVGYLRPVQDWNKGKQQEFAERRMYVVRGVDLGSPDLPPVHDLVSPRLAPPVSAAGQRPRSRARQPGQVAETTPTSPDLASA